MRYTIALLGCLLLPACRTLPTPAPEAAAAATPQATAAQRQREQALGLAAGDCAAPAWAMRGRVALSNGRDGGSGQLEWTQGGGATRVELSAPVTRQNWVLEVDPAGASLHGVPDGPRRGTDPGSLLREATGWDIPVAALGCWVRGAAAASEGLGAPRIGYGPDLLPMRIEQGGWTIDYGAWMPDPTTRLPMPSRINAQRGADRVRVVVDRWAAE